MRRIIIMTVACLLSVTAAAQASGRISSHTTVGAGRPASNVVQFRARGMNESFVVYVDGVPCNNAPQQQVMLTDMGFGEHEVIVRLVYPADRAVSLLVDFDRQGMTYLVDFDMATGVLSLSAPGSGLAMPATQPAPYGTTVDHRAHGDHPSHAHGPHAPHHATDMEVADAIKLINKHSFDSDKLNMARTFVLSKHVLTSQAITIAKTLNFDDSRLDFLLFAYDYCADPQNYYQTVDQLTYSSSKKKLMEKIQRR